MAEALVKQMTGGERMVARFMRAEFFEFMPEFKVFLATNHKPEIKGTDHAIWRRIRLIPFEVVIPDDEQDKALLAKLLDEMPGILSWAVQGCLAWQKVGLGTPPEILRATSKYRAEMDVLAGFIEECCRLALHEEASIQALYNSYAEWCSDSGERPIGKRQFGIRMKERGFDQERRSDSRYWIGIGLKSQPEQKALQL